MTEQKSFPATSEGLAAGAAWLDELCPNPRISIVFDELASNIVRCSGATTFTVALTRDGKSAVMTLSDDGAEFDPTGHPAPDLTASAEERPIGGLGLYMVTKMTKSFTYRREGGRNIVTLEMMV